MVKRLVVIVLLAFVAAPSFSHVPDRCQSKRKAWFDAQHEVGIAEHGLDFAVALYMKTQSSRAQQSYEEAKDKLFALELLELNRLAAFLECVEGKG